jgi:uncharacterized tellurite resistance protein B-like protein
MGLFQKLLGNNNAAKKAGDDVLLLHSLMLMAAADGVIEDSEIMTLQSFVNTLPEFRDKDFRTMFDQARKVASRFKDVRDSVKALAEIESDAVKKKCFILAVDMAFASGDVDSSEEELLEAMQRVLNIPDDLAKKTLEVFALKYAT